MSPFVSQKIYCATFDFALFRGLAVMLFMLYFGRVWGFGVACGLLAVIECFCCCVRPWCWLATLLRCFVRLDVCRSAWLDGWSAADLCLLRC